MYFVPLIFAIPLLVAMMSTGARWLSRARFSHEKHSMSSMCTCQAWRDRAQSLLQTTGRQPMREAAVSQHGHPSTRFGKRSRSICDRASESESGAAALLHGPRAPEKGEHMETKLPSKQKSKNRLKRTNHIQYILVVIETTKVPRHSLKTMDHKMHRNNQSIRAAPHGAE